MNKSTSQEFAGLFTKQRI